MQGLREGEVLGAGRAGQKSASITHCPNQHVQHARCLGLAGLSKQPTSIIHLSSWHGHVSNIKDWIDQEADQEAVPEAEAEVLHLWLTAKARPHL